MRDPNRLNEQYATDDALRIRQQTHAQYSTGMNLELAVDGALNLNTTAALLDLGTGPGDYPARLRREGHLGRLVGVDRSSGMVGQASTTHADLESLEFIEADAMHLPFPDASFDAVTARHMLYHVPDLDRALLEARRVLKPGGRFLALTNADGYMHEFWNLALESVRDVAGFESMIAAHSTPLYFHANLERDIHRVFGNAELRLLEGALVFPDPQPCVRYFDSCRTQYGIEPDVWATGSAAFRSRLEAVAYPWRVSKSVALILAMKN